MLILECVEKKRCGESIRVGYCPLPVLCHDTVVVSRQEGRGTHDQGPTRACQGRPIATNLLGFSVVIENSLL